MPPYLASLKAFVAALEEAPESFEVVTYHTFPPLSEADITAAEDAFWQQLQGTDPARDAPAANACFMPYGSAEQQAQLLLPQSPPRLSPELRAFYSTTNGLQLLWHYHGLKDNRVNATRFYDRLLTGGAYDWNYTHLIDHHWSMGSVMIKPLEQVLAMPGGEGNFYWSEKGKRNIMYPVLPWDCYDDWATGALLLRDDSLSLVVQGEDAMASFTDDAHPTPAADYLTNHLGHYGGSILLRTRSSKLALSTEPLTAQALSDHIEAWHAQRGSW